MGYLAVGPTRALREALEAKGALYHRELVEIMATRGVGGARADRAIRRALSHEQLETDMEGRYVLARGPRAW